MRQVFVKGHGTIRARSSAIAASSRTVVEQLELRRMLAGNAPLLSDVFVTPAAYEGDPATAFGTVIDFDTTDSHTLTVNWNDPNAAAAVYAIDEVANLSEGQVINPTTGSGALTILAVDADAGVFVFSADHVYADDGASPGNGTFADTSGVDITVADSGGESVTMPTIINAVTGFESGSPAFDTDTTPAFAPILTGQILISGGYAFAGTSNTAYTIEVHDVASNSWIPVFSDTIVADTQIEFANTNINFPATTIDQIRLSIDSSEGGIFVFENPSITIGHTVQVFNLAPELSNVAVTNADQNAPVTLTGDLFDAGALDALTVQINWGDPASPGNTQTLTLPAGSTTFSVNHTYANIGTYDISVSLVDDDGGIAPGAPVGTVIAGPSALGYVATEADFESINLQAGINGAFTVLDNAFDAIAPLSLGSSTFNFYGTEYSDITVSTRGVLIVGDGLIAALDSNWTTDVDAFDQILARFDDTNNDNIPDRLIIEWSEVQPFGESPSTATFQTILQLNTAGAGDIVFNYSDLNTGNASSRQGSVFIAGGEPLETLSINNNGTNPYIDSGTAVRFSVNQVTTVSTTISEVVVTNTAPTADAGDAYSSDEGVGITLDGTGSSDAEQDASTLGYAWSVTNASNVVVLSGVGATLNFVPADNGVYTATLTVTDDGSLVSSDSATISVANIAPSASVDVPSQTVNAGSNIAPVTITASDVAADVVSASVANLPSGLTFAQTAAGVWTITGSVATAGSYTATVTVADEDGGVTTTDVSFTVNAVVAQATAEYTGATLATTASATTNTASVNLRATVAATSGDVRNAVVTFYVYDTDTNALVATVNGGAISLLTAGDTSAGTTSASWTANIGSDDSRAFRVVVGVSGGYTGESGSELIQVARPSNNTLTAAGYTINNGTSAGTLAGESGERTTYALTSRYNRNQGLRGTIAMLIRSVGSDGRTHTYAVAGDLIESLGTDGSTGHGMITARVTIIDVTNLFRPVTIATNVTLQITATDNGTPGRNNDTIGSTIWNADGSLLFASSWNGYETIEQTLAGGNVRVV